MKYLKLFENFERSINNWIGFMKSSDYFDIRFIDFVSENKELFSGHIKYATFELFFKNVAKVTNYTFDIINEHLKSFFELYTLNNEETQILDKYIEYLNKYNNTRYKDLIKERTKQQTIKKFNI